MENGVLAYQTEGVIGIITVVTEEEELVTVDIRAFLASFLKKIFKLAVDGAVICCVETLEGFSNFLNILLWLITAYIFIYFVNIKRFGRSFFWTGSLFNILCNAGLGGLFGRGRAMP